jgi:basic membrane protein A
MALVALALSGCSSAPVSVEPTPVAFRACQVSEKNTDSQADSEQITYALQKAKIANGIHLLRTSVEVNSNSTAAIFAPMLKKNCSLVVTSGSALAPLAAKAAKLHPKVNFFTVVYNSDLDEFSSANFRTIRYDVGGVAFLAGYAAASTSKVGKVAVLGGAKDARTKTYVESFKAGVANFNTVQAASVRVLGDELSIPTYVGSSDDAALVQTAIAEQVAFGADVIFVAAGPASVAAGSLGLSQKPALIFADSDWWLDPAADGFKNQILTSATVNLSDMVYSSTVAAMQGGFTALPAAAVGNLSNGGTTLAPTHSTSFSVALANQLSKLTEDINSGKVITK